MIWIVLSRWFLMGACFAPRDVSVLMSWNNLDTESPSSGCDDIESASWRPPVF
jgi:hypothetical protein